MKKTKKQIVQSHYGFTDEEIDEMSMAEINDLFSMFMESEQKKSEGESEE